MLARDTLAAALAAQSWQEARTWAATAPHEYVVRAAWQGAVPFEAVVTTLQTTGYVGHFGRRAYRYVDCAGYTYWTMGESPPRTQLINRKPRQAAP